ncbi:nascent polypeptide-associated complex subunit alpha, muscle-specific form-like isoform X2 [Hetaerina americana]|uniref:nascent polypeptide-associated complex subunit alpha, muscle-specific form-like isoform X2 n=1 Tax=Hetaerina americana TaxID=62018 RepID=UPI003A7F1749
MDKMSVLKAEDEVIAPDLPITNINADVGEIREERSNTSQDCMAVPHGLAQDSVTTSIAKEQEYAKPLSTQSNIERESRRRMPRMTRSMLSHAASQGVGTKRKTYYEDSDGNPEELLASTDLKLSNELSLAALLRCAYPEKLSRMTPFNSSSLPIQDISRPSIPGMPVSPSFSLPLIPESAKKSLANVLDMMLGPSSGQAPWKCSSVSTSEGTQGLVKGPVVMREACTLSSSARISKGAESEAAVGTPPETSAINHPNPMEVASGVTSSQKPSDNKGTPKDNLETADLKVSNEISLNALQRCPNAEKLSPRMSPPSSSLPRHISGVSRSSIPKIPPSVLVNSPLIPKSAGKPSANVLDITLGQSSGETPWKCSSGSTSEGTQVLPKGPIVVVPEICPQSSSAGAAAEISPETSAINQSNPMEVTSRATRSHEPSDNEDMLCV